MILFEKFKELTPIAFVPLTGKKTGSFFMGLRITSRISSLVWFFMFFAFAALELSSLMMVTVSSSSKTSPTISYQTQAEYFDGCNRKYSIAFKPISLHCNNNFRVEALSPSWSGIALTLRAAETSIICSHTSPGSASKQKCFYGFIIIVCFTHQENKH